VYAINPGPLKFFDISIVNKSADRTAWALQKAAQDNGSYSEGYKTSAELGEEYMDIQEKVAAITKFSEMLKELDADPIKMKDGDDKYRVHKALRDQAMQSTQGLDFELPHVPFADLKASGVSPGGLLSSIVASGAPLSLNEMAFAAGKHHLGDAFEEKHMSSILSSMRPSLDILKQRPGLLQGLISAVLNDTDQPDGVEITIKIEPMAKKRRAMIIGMAAPGWEASQEKVASEILRTLPIGQRQPVREYEQVGVQGPFRRASNTSTQNLTTNSPSITENFMIRGTDGKLYRTDRASVQAAQRTEAAPSIIRGLTSAGLTMAALGAALSDNDLATKLISVPILAALAYGVGTGGNHTTIQTLEGMEVPSSTLFSQVKEAGIKIAMKGGRLGPAIGAAVPAALALDYIYNKHIKHRGNPYYREGLGRVEKGMDMAGGASIARPFTALGASALIGGTASALIKRRFGIKR